VRSPRNAEERLQRLLVMLPWLMEMGEVPLVDVARRFDMSEADVQKNLELVAMCGLPPFVDEMVDVFVDEGIVYVGVPRLFTRPLRLTAPEGFALLASARAAMELPGADEVGSLGRGLAKLAAVLDDVGLDTGDVTAGVAFDLDRPASTDELAEYTATGSEVMIDHYSPDRDEVTRRTIVPRHVFVESGRWYVVADDGRSGERRTFRIDRIERIVPTGRRVPTEEYVTAPSGFFIDADVPRAVLRLAPQARWITEEYPVDEVTELSAPDGWVEVRLPVANRRWLSRLLIRLGPNAVLVEPATASVEAVDLARQVLHGYD
jgi:proteasome accessory factor C